MKNIKTLFVAFIATILSLNAFAFETNKSMQADGLAERHRMDDLMEQIEKESDDIANFYSTKINNDLLFFDAKLAKAKVKDPWKLNPNHELYKELVMYQERLDKLRLRVAKLNDKIKEYNVLSYQVNDCNDPDLGICELLSYDIADLGLMDEYDVGNQATVLTEDFYVVKLPWMFEVKNVSKEMKAAQKRARR